MSLQNIQRLFSINFEYFIINYNLKGNPLNLLCHKTNFHNELGMNLWFSYIFLLNPIKVSNRYFTTYNSLLLFTSCLTELSTDVLHVQCYVFNVEYLKSSNSIFMYLPCVNLIACFIK